MGVTTPANDVADIHAMNMNIERIVLMTARVIEFVVFIASVVFVARW